MPLAKKLSNFKPIFRWKVPSTLTSSNYTPAMIKYGNFLTYENQLNRIECQTPITKTNSRGQFNWVNQISLPFHLNVIRNVWPRSSQAKSSEFKATRHNQKQFYYIYWNVSVSTEVKAIFEYRMSHLCVNYACKFRINTKIQTEMEVFLYLNDSFNCVINSNSIKFSEDFPPNKFTFFSNGRKP